MSIVDQGLPPWKMAASYYDEAVRLAQYVDAQSTWGVMGCQCCDVRRRPLYLKQLPSSLRCSSRQPWVRGCLCGDVRSMPAVPRTAADFAVLQQSTALGQEPTLAAGVQTEPTGARLSPDFAEVQSERLAPPLDLRAICHECGKSINMRIRVLPNRLEAPGWHHVCAHRPSIEGRVLTRDRKVPVQVKFRGRDVFGILQDRRTLTQPKNGPVSGTTNFVGALGIGEAEPPNPITFWCAFTAMPGVWVPRANCRF